MTETAIASTTLTTPLAILMASAAKPPRMAEYRGVLTPRELDAPTKETAALIAGAAVHDLGWLKRVAVRGEDRFRWLNGMVTNTVNELGPDAGAWNLVLNAQGRIQGDLTVWREADALPPRHRKQAAAAPGSKDRFAATSLESDSELDLEIAADQYDRLLAHLELHIIMDDVELVPAGQDPSAAATALGLTGPLAGEVLGRMGLPVPSELMTGTHVEWNGLDLRILRVYGVLAPHYELWAPAAGLARLWRTLSTAGASPVGVAAIEALRIAEGIPTYAIDMMERDLPQETSQMRALHFNKGCYLGQEIVERIRSRGNVHRHLRSLELDGPVPEAGAELTLDGAPAGQITSAARWVRESGSRVFALGMIRGEAELRNQPLSYAAGTAVGTARILTAPPDL